MKEFLSLALFALLILVNLRCKFPFRTESSVINRFLLQSGNFYKYKRTFYVAIYDTIHNDTLKYLVTNIVYEKYDDIDTISSWFSSWSCYKILRTIYGENYTSTEIWWYSQTETALLWIAYTLNYKDIPKVKSKIKFCIGKKIFSSLEELSSYLYFLRHGIMFRKSDTILWSPPKKLFALPLKIGVQWIAMTDPWLEGRKVIAKENVNVPAGKFLCLKIQINSEWMQEKDSWYLWVKNIGIIKDSLHFGVEAYDTSGNLIGHGEGYDVYNLEDYHIE